MPTRLTPVTVSNPAPAATAPRAPSVAVTRFAPPLDSFSKGTGQKPRRLAPLVDGVLASPPTHSPSALVEELHGPRGWEVMDLLCERLATRPRAAAALMLNAPERLGHRHARALLDATMCWPESEGPVLDTFARLARSKGEQAGWAGRLLVERALKRPDAALETVSALAREGNAPVNGALLTYARSTAREDQDASTRALQVMLLSGERVPVKVAERFGAALGRSFGPRAVVQALVAQAAEGDEAALRTLETAALKRPEAKGALRDAYDAAVSAPVRSRLGAQLERWSDFAGEKDFERALGGAKLGFPGAIKALALEASFGSTRQARAAEVLGELATKGNSTARRELLALPTGWGASPQLVRAKLAAVKTLDEARAFLDGLEAPLRSRDAALAGAAAAAAASLRAQLRPQHQEWLLDGLRGQALRAPGPMPSAEAAAALLDVPGFEDRLLGGLDAFTAAGIVAVYEGRVPSPRAVNVLGAFLADAHRCPGQAAVAGLLVRNLATPGVLEELSTPAFSRLTEQQQRAVVDAAASSTEEGVKAALLAQLPESPVLDRLEAVARAWQAALVAELRAAPRDSQLGKLGQYLGALQLAERPEYRGRIDVDAVKRRVQELTTSLQPKLDELRRKVVAPHADLVEKQAEYLGSAAFELRARLLPPRERAELVERSTSALAALSSERSRALTATRFAALPEQAQRAVLEASGLGAEPSLRAELVKWAELVARPAAKLAGPAASAGAVNPAVAKALDRLCTGLTFLALNPADALTVLDCAEQVGSKAASAARPLATGLAVKALGVASGALSVYDAGKAFYEMTDEWAKGDVVGAAAKLGSGSSSVGMLVGGWLVAATNPAGWTVLAISAATWLGSELAGRLFGEDDTESQLRALGVWAG